MKKFSAIILCLLMIVTFTLTGCAGFSINHVKYYNEVMATVGGTKITRHELLNAYSSYGQSYYVQQQGQEPEEALKSTLDLLIDREVLYQYAISNKDKFGLSEKQVNEAVQAVFDSLDNQMKSYVNSAKTMLSIEIEEEKDEEKSEDALKIEDYKYHRRAKVVDEIVYYTNADMSVISADETDYFRINSKIEYDIKEDNSFNALIDGKYLKDYTLSGIEGEILNKYKSHFESSLAKEEKKDAIKNKALELLATDLINYEHYLRDENGKAYNTKTDDLLTRFIKRNFESQIKSEYLENIRVDYLKNEDLSINELLLEFEDLVRLNHDKYKNHETEYKNAMKDIGTKGDTILWHNNNLSDGTKFGYFAHTLLNFSETQKNEIAAINKETKLSESERNEKIMSVISKTKVSVRSSKTELVTEETKTFNEVMAKYEAITRIADYETRLNAFIEFMFKYTGDTATLSAGMPYVVGTNGNSAMETAFTDEAVRLIKDGVEGGMSKVVNDNTGSFDDLCVTSYGVHFLFYIGNVDKFDIPYSSYESAYISATDKPGMANSNLFKKPINPLTDETYFDMLFDKVYPAASAEENYTSNNGYSDFEKALIANAKNSIKVIKNISKIEGTRV